MNAAPAQGITEVIAISDVAAPDGNGAFDLFFVPVLNDSGQATFQAILTGTSGGVNDNEGMFRGSGGAVTQIARRGQAAPDGNGTYVLFNSPALNASGQVAFQSTLTGTSGGASDDIGVFLGAGGAVVQVAREGQAVPDGNGAFSSFNAQPALNASGQAAFLASLTGTSGGASDDIGVFLGAGGAVVQVAREGQAVPDGNGAFLNFSNPALNASGQAAFQSTLTGTSGGTSDDTGIFRGAGGAVTQIAREGQGAPDGNGAFFSFNAQPALNASGQAAFLATLTGTSGGTSDDSGIFLGAGGAVTQIARESQAAPDGNGVLSFISNPALNASGQAAFPATLAGTSGGASDDTGIFLGDVGAPGSLTQIAREGQAAPDGNGAFGSFGTTQPALNASGQAAFLASLTGTSGGGSDNTGIFLANGIDILQVAREGDALGGSTITFLDINSSTGANNDERSGINDAGQVAYRATLASGDQAIVRFTIPDIHWTAPGSGDWSTDANWTQATEPNSFHDTLINPANSLTVTAPATNTTVASLTLGGGTGTATLRLAGDTTGDMHALGAATIDANGVLHLTDGRVFVAPALDNAGMIHGEGTIDAPVSNSGEVESIGEQLVFSQLVTNNASTGLVTGRDAVFRFNGGLTNNGAVALSFGTSDIHGDIDNAGNIVVTGNSNATFYDDVDNSGAVNVSTGSTAVFLGALTGNGTNGTGTVFLEGDVQPGSSPGVMSFGGDVHFGFFSALAIELAGDTPAPGSEFDVLNVAGTAAVAGSLDIELIDGFVPNWDDSFTIVNAASVAGTFNAVNSEHVQFDVVYNPDTVVLNVTGFVLPGDFDLDGDVDLDDYNILSGNMYTGGAEYGDGDANGDGNVDFEDFVIHALHFGETNPEVLGEALPGVPEPGTAVVLLALIAGFRRRRAG